MLQAVRRCVGAADDADAKEVAELCLVADRLSAPASPLDVSPAVLAALQAWWGKRMPATTPLSDQTYLAVAEK